MQNQRPPYGATIFSGDVNDNDQDQNRGEFTVYSPQDEVSQAPYEQTEQVAVEQVSSVLIDQTPYMNQEAAEVIEENEMVMVALQETPARARSQEPQLNPPEAATVVAAGAMQSAQSVPSSNPTFTESTAAVSKEQVIQQESVAEQPQALMVDELKLRPSTSVLIFRLLGAGLVLLLILFFLALTVDIIRFAFGDQVLTLLNNRMFTFTLGIIIYMLVGWVIYEQWSHTVYTLTSQKLVIEQGWLFKNRQTRDMVQFGGVQVRQSFIGKIFNFGDLRMDYHGAIGKVAGETLHDIPDPFLHEQMLSRMFAPAL